MIVATVVEVGVAVVVEAVVAIGEAFAAVGLAVVVVGDYWSCGNSCVISRRGSTD